MLEDTDCGVLVEPLLDWYQKNRRILPWREDPTPYHVWISEIMLQQTRVEAVMEYYRRFLRELPDIRSLSVCPEDRLMKLWEGLGYYNRVRNMQKAAKRVMDRFHGELPADVKELESLPGIGSYTAGAIGSIAFGLPVPAVDGNVLRVLSRVSADDSDIAKQAVKKRAEKYLFLMMQKKFAEKPELAGTFNQAMMDLGACVCIPNGAPHCTECPWKENCLAYKEDLTGSLPYKSGKKPRKIENRTVLIIRDGERVLLQKRPDRGLLAGLYEFPNPEGNLSEKEALDYVRNMHLEPLHIEKLEGAKHVFSHIEWHMTGYEIRVDSLTSEQAGQLFASLSEYEESYAIPSAFAVYKKILWGK